jgi:hypothetical protein
MKTKILLTILSFNLICMGMVIQYDQATIDRKKECEDKGGNFSQPQGLCLKDLNCVIQLTGQLNGDVNTQSNVPVQLSGVNNQLGDAGQLSVVNNVSEINPSSSQLNQLNNSSFSNPAGSENRFQTF